MDDNLKLTEKQNQQLMERIRFNLENDTLNIVDWMKMYDIMLEACERESIDVQEQMMMKSIEGSGEEC